MILANVLLTRTEPIGSRFARRPGLAGRDPSPPGRRDPGPPAATPARPAATPARPVVTPARPPATPARLAAQSRHPRPLNHSHGAGTSRQTPQQTLKASRES
jgi:hypothetical protein